MLKPPVCLSDVSRHFQTRERAVRSSWEAPWVHQVQQPPPCLREWESPAHASQAAAATPPIEGCLVLNHSQAMFGAFLSLSHHYPMLDSIFQAQGMGAGAFVFPGRATSPSRWRYLIVIIKASDVTIFARKTGRFSSMTGAHNLHGMGTARDQCGFFRDNTLRIFYGIPGKRPRILRDKAQHKLVS